MESKFRRVVVLTFIYWGCIVSLWADGDGGQAGAFLRYGIGGRALGMGRAFVAVADDASGVFWNPAGIVGIKRFELTSMYSNLYYDSQFAQFGIAFPRPGSRNSISKFLLGPSSALGCGWIGLTTTGYEQRTNTGVLLGDFGINENAFLFAWAREEVGEWGILRYGLGLKFVSQDFSGILQDASIGFQEVNQDWSWGMDLGFTFQPIHAPVFKIVSLKYLLPLRLGLVVQNIIQPRWNITGQHRETFPIILRWGLSYKIILRDWFPSSWEYLNQLVGNSYILVAFDRENYKGNLGSSYFGAEGFFQISQKGFSIFPRIGFNNCTEGTSLGLGISMPFTPSAVIRIDYAYGFHPYLPDDSRFFLTIQMGRELNAKYFKKMSEREGIKEQEFRDYYFRILADYPNEQVEEIVNKLAESADSLRIKRYHDLIGGLGRAEWLLREAKTLLKQKKVNKARKISREAIEEYTPIFIRSEHSLSDKELLDYGESLIITDQMPEAITVLEEVETLSLRVHFLRGICKKAVGDWDGAIEEFRNAVKRYEQEQDLNSMVCLSLLGLGETLIKKGHYQSALTTLKVLLKNYKGQLDPDYPHYPIFNDGYVLDDAQFLGGIIVLLMKRPYEGIADLLKTQRFYPELDYGKLVKKEADKLIKAFESSNWDRLSNLAELLLKEYFKAHE